MATKQTGVTLLDTDSLEYRKRLTELLNDKYGEDGFISAGSRRFNTARMFRKKMQIIFAGDEACNWEDVGKGQLFYDQNGKEIVADRKP